MILIISLCFFLKRGKQNAYLLELHTVIVPDAKIMWGFASEQEVGGAGRDINETRLATST